MGLSVARCLGPPKNTPPQKAFQALFGAMWTTVGMEHIGTEHPTGRLLRFEGVLESRAATIMETNRHYSLRSAAARNVNTVVLATFVRCFRAGLVLGPNELERIRSLSRTDWPVNRPSVGERSDFSCARHLFNNLPG